MDDCERRRLHLLIRCGWLERHFPNNEIPVHYRTTQRGLEKLAEQPPADRVACINPACGRTWKKEFDGEEVICKDCFKLVPELRAEYRRQRAILAKAKRSWKTANDDVMIDALNKSVWRVWGWIRDAFRQEEKPEGMEAFLSEIGLRDAEDG